MPRGELSTEVETIAIQDSQMPFGAYKDLPLVSTGCDSYASWDPRFKDYSPMLTSEAIVDRIMEIIPHNDWQDEHLVITADIQMQNPNTHILLSCMIYLQMGSSLTS